MGQANTTFEQRVHIKNTIIDVEHIGRYKLCFQLGKQQCDVVVFDMRTHDCILFESYQTPTPTNNNQKLLDRLKQLIHTHSFLSATYWQKVVFIIQDRSFAFIPDELFDTEHALGVLRLNAQVNPITHYIQFSEHLASNIKCVFTVFKPLSDWLEKQYPNCVIAYSHQTAAFLEGTLTQALNAHKEQLHLLFCEKQLIILVLEKEKLVFINTFHVESPEDCLYYVLLVAQELDISTEQASLILYGNIVKESHTITLLRRYIKDISFTERPNTINFSEKFDSLESQRYFELFSAYFVN